MFSAPFRTLFVKAWKQFTLPKPLNSWIVDRFDKYVFAVEVLSPLDKVTQLTKSHNILSDRGHVEVWFRADSYCEKQ
jgi:hypothetical protein